MNIIQLKNKLVKEPIYIACSDGWYQQYTKIPKGLDSSVVLDVIQITIPEVYLDSNDMGDEFLERAWKTKEEIPEELHYLIQK